MTQGDLDPLESLGTPSYRKDLGVPDLRLNPSVRGSLVVRDHRAFPSLLANLHGHQVHWGRELLVSLWHRDSPDFPFHLSDSETLGDRQHL